MNHANDVSALQWLAPATLLAAPAVIAYIVANMTWNLPVNARQAFVVFAVSMTINYLLMLMIGGAKR